MTLVTFLLAFGLALRLTRLVTTDSISEPARHAVDMKAGDSFICRWASVGLACDWCVGVWASAFAFSYAYSANASFVWVAAAASASYLVGIIQMASDWLSTAGMHDHDHA